LSRGFVASRCLACILGTYSPLFTTRVAAWYVLLQASICMCVRMQHDAADDSCRVVLHGSSSDYINASHVEYIVRDDNDHDVSACRYIATQVHVCVCYCSVVWLFYACVGSRLLSFNISHIKSD